MPAILSQEEALAWLKTGDTALLKPCPPSALATWPISTRVNSPANNDPRLTEKATPLAPVAEAAANDKIAEKPAQLSLLL
jgi:putative SOS response-associated peptidase YedK